MSFSAPPILQKILSFLSWIPFFLFFLILSAMLLRDFSNPVDSYFVNLVLTACLILLFATALAHAAALVVLWVHRMSPAVLPKGFFKASIRFLNAFPLLEMGIFSVAIFFTAPVFRQWVVLIAALLIIPTLRYWQRNIDGPYMSIYKFSKLHGISRSRSLSSAAGHLLGTFIDYFFVVLKRALLPLVFILVVMDFKIILPRLVNAGMSYQSFVMFLCLIVCLHLLSFKGEESND